MQEVILHPAAYTFPANSLTVEEAALAEPLSVGVYATRQLHIETGDMVLVIGGGPVGLLSALASEVRGATVTVIEINPTRIRLGREMGLTVVTPDDLSPTTIYDHVLECTGSAAGIELALRFIRTHGKIALIGLGDSDHMKVNALTVSQRGLQVYGIFRYAHTFPASIKILRDQQTRLGPLIQNKIALDDVPIFFAQGLHQHSLKTIVAL
jgi:L-iditol 2-dehydrogenase